MKWDNFVLRMFRKKRITGNIINEVIAENLSYLIEEIDIHAQNIQLLLIESTKWDSRLYMTLKLSKAKVKMKIMTKKPDIYKGIFQRNYHQQLVKQKL